MTPSKLAKSYGFKTLKEASDLSSIPRDTLKTWFYHETKRKKLEKILEAFSLLKKENESND